MWPSHKIYIESSHVGPAPLPFRFSRRMSSSSATVNIVVTATAAPAVATAVSLSPLSPSLLPPLFCLRRHRTLLPLLLPSPLPSLPPPLSLLVDCFCSCRRRRSRSCRRCHRHFFRCRFELIIVRARHLCCCRHHCCRHCCHCRCYCSCHCHHRHCRL